MFPSTTPIINVDMIYQYQTNPYVGFVPGFNPSPLIQQIPQQNPFLSQLLHTQQQIINSQILQNASISASILAQQQMQANHQQQQMISSSTSSLPTSSTTEINDNDLTTSSQPETQFDDKIKLATWNVRGALEMDKLNAIDKCLNEKMIQIACIQETKLQVTQLETANYRWHLINRKNDHNVHCGTAILVRHSFNAAVTNFEAVTGNILSCFVRSKQSTILLISAHLTEDIGAEIEFHRLKNFLKLYESLPTIILGDFNAQLGKLDIVNEDHPFIGTFLYHDKCNSNGRLLKDLASEAKLFIKNTFRCFKWKFILTTCRLKEKTSSSKAVEAQLDHMLTSRDGTVFVKMLRGFYRNSIKTDHKMIVADIEIRDCEREANENVIDLSQEDNVPYKYEDGEKKSSKEMIDIQDQSEEVVESNKMLISPGEPVPPGFEDVVKPVAELQVILSKYRISPMIGLEYVVELIMGDRRPRTYHCALCDKISDTKDIIEHLKSYEHRSKYLEKHFSTVMSSLSQYRHHSGAKSVLAGVVEAVCDSIEDAYGRMVPNVFENKDYTTNRAMYMKKLARERHFDEKSGSTFVRVIDHKAIQSAFETLNQPHKSVKTTPKRTRTETSTRSKRSSLDSISSGESMPTLAYKKTSSSKRIEPVLVAKVNLDLVSSDSEDESHAKKQNKSLDLVSSDSDDESRAKKRKKVSSNRSLRYEKKDETDEFKYERYRLLAEQAVKKLTNVLQEYEKCPEKHPSYPSEWKRYWSRRSNELEGAGIDPLTFDFSAEWSKYWIRRLRDLYDDEIALKKFEIRKMLNLPTDYYPSSSSSANYNEPSSSFNYKDDVRNENSRMQSYPLEQVTKDEADSEPLTVISVLRLLAALEDLLGATLGKKVLDLLSKAVHLEKLKANLADDVLMNEENSVLLDTVKEKLKGLIIAKIVNSQQMNAVRRAIRNVDSIVAVIDNKIAVRKVENEVQPNRSEANTRNDQMWTEQQNSKMEKQSFNRKEDNRLEIMRQIATAFVIQKINISRDCLEELTTNFMSESRDSSETPYLFGVRMSQNEFNFSSKSSNPSTALAHSSSNPQSQIKQQHSSNAGSGFSFGLFDRNARNLDNSNNFNNRTNNFGDSFAQHNSPQKAMNSNQSNQKFTSSDQFHQQNSMQQNSFNVSMSQQNNQHSNQRFQMQSSSNTHQQSKNPSNKQMNQKGNFNQSKQRQQNHMKIWEFDAMMPNQLCNNTFDSNPEVNSIWDTNPMQASQGQQQFNQGSFQQKHHQQSQYNNFSYQQNRSGMNSNQPIWDHQFSQLQNNRNSRHN